MDRVLVYVTLYIIECLKRLGKVPTQERATQEMYTMALEPFALPGESGFPLNAFFAKPSRNEADELKKYFTQVHFNFIKSLVSLLWQIACSAFLPWSDCLLEM